MSSEVNPQRDTLVEESPIVEVRNLFKEYRLGALEGLRALGRRLLRQKAVPTRQQFLALNDISLTIRRGEVVGIIGHNGAGKSTFLKHLCRITHPTSGSVTVRGRVAPLIEVGAGLVGEMTGRENIFLNATILGLTRHEIESKVDEIIDFAELEKFIDTPIKRYSSGMQVRLGFSIAVAVSADLLLIDEVLAVGDVAFQNKCIDKLTGQLYKDKKTAIIVGHNIRQLERICTRMIYMKNGKIVIDGAPAMAAAAYFSDALHKYSKDREVNHVSELIPSESDGNVIVHQLEVLGLNSDNSLKTNASFDFCIDFETKKDLEQPELVFGIHTIDKVHLISVSNINDEKRPSYKIGTHRVSCRIHNNPLRSGVYGIRFGILGKYRQVYWYGENLREVLVSSGQINEAHLPASGLLFSDSSWIY